MKRIAIVIIHGAMSALAILDWCFKTFGMLFELVISQLDNWLYALEKWLAFAAYSPREFESYQKDETTR